MDVLIQKTTYFWYTTLHLILPQYDVQKQNNTILLKVTSLALSDLRIEQLNDNFHSAQKHF